MPCHCSELTVGPNVVLCIVAVMFMGCRPDESPPEVQGRRTATGEVVLLDSLQLAVPDSAALGTFSYITAEASGGVLISDAGRGRLLRYGQDGELRQVVGRYGGGPGEFLGVSVARHVQDDTVLAVMDPKRQYMSFLNAGSGEFMSGMPMPFREPGQTWTVNGESAVFAVEAASFLFGVLNLHDSTFRPLGKIPARLMENLFLYLSYGRVEVLPDGHGFLAMVPMLQGIQVLDSIGDPLGMVDVPVRARRGKPADLLEQQSGVTDPRRLVGSVDGALGRLRDGTIVILNMDVTFADAMPPIPSEIKYYVSLLSKDLSKACVDLPVPHDPAATGPWPTFDQGDLLITAEHIEADSVRTVLYRYGVDTDDCDWIETSGLQPSPLADLPPAPSVP